MTVSCARYFDIRKARRVLGYDPIVDLSDGVTRACKVVSIPSHHCVAGLILQAYVEAGSYRAAAPVPDTAPVPAKA